MEKAQVNNNGIGFLGLLTIVFITLKLTKAIDWSWWWITSPIWGVVAFYAIVILFFVLFGTVLKKTKEDENSVTYRAAESKFQKRMREMMEQERAKNK